MIEVTDVCLTLEQYARSFPDDRQVVNQLLTLIYGGAAITDRKEFSGHITCGGVLVSGDGKLLMVCHGVLNEWLFPGGHLESRDTGTRDAAIREVKEEVGVAEGTLDKFGNFLDEIPIQIDRHLIPENPEKKEPAHYHFDFRYAFRVFCAEISINDKEIVDCKWVDPVLAPDVVNYKICKRLSYIA